MALKFRCPHCIRKIACPHEAMGLYLACPHCDARVRVPIWAELGDLTPADIKKAQKSQVERAKQSASAASSSSPAATPDAREEMPIQTTQDPNSSEAMVPPASSRPPRPESPSIPMSDDEDNEIVLEMSDGSGGPNETDELLASLAQAQDTAPEEDLDLQVERRESSRRGSAKRNEPQPDDVFVGSDEDGTTPQSDDELSESLADLAQAFDEVSEPNKSRKKRR